MQRPLTSHPLPQPEVVVRRLPHFPTQGNIEDYQPQNGQVISDQHLSYFYNEFVYKPFELNHQEDKYRWKAMVNSNPNSPLRQNIYRKNNHFFTAHAKVHKGVTGTARLVQHHSTKEWYIVKTVPYREQERINSAFRDFDVASKLGLTFGQPGINPSTKTGQKINYIIKLQPGLDYYDCLEYSALCRPSDILMLHMAHEMVKKLHALHTHPTCPILHNDLHLSNVMFDLAGKQVNYIDFDRALSYSEKGQLINKYHYYTATSVGKKQMRQSVLDSAKQPGPKKTVNFTHPFVYDKNSEIHALGIMLAQWFGLFDYAATKKFAESDSAKYLNPNPDKTYVLDEKHPAYATNQYLPNPILRKRVLNFLQRMTSEKDVPSLAEAEAFFLKAKLDCLKSAECKKIQVAILDVGDYITLMLKAQEVQFDPTHEDTKLFHKLVFALKSASEVRLTDSFARSDDDYIHLVHQLSANYKLTVDQKVYISPNKIACLNKIKNDLEVDDLSGAYEYVNAKELMELVKLPEHENNQEIYGDIQDKNDGGYYSEPENHESRNALRSNLTRNLSM